MKKKLVILTILGLVSAAALAQEPADVPVAQDAIEEIPAPETDAALLQSLMSSSGDAKIGIVNELGNRKCAAGVAALAELVKNEDVALAGAAVVALGQIATMDACAQLEALALEARPEIADTLYESLLQCADTMLAAGQKAEAIRIYNAVMESPLPARMAAFQGMVNALGEEGVDLVFMRIKEGGADFRDMAVRIARTLPGEDVTRRLAEAVSEVDAAGQILLLDVLAERGGADARSAAVAATESPEEAVRIASLAALTKVGTEADVMMLARMAAGTTGGEQQAAREALYKLRGEAVDQGILRSVETADAAVCAELIRASAARRLCAALPVLLTLAASPGNEALRVEAIAGIVELARPMYGACRTDVETALAGIEQLSQDESVLQEIAALREMASRFDDFIVAWEVSGPYMEPGKGPGELFDSPFAPEDPAATGVVWQTMPTGTSVEKPWMLDLKKFFGGSNCVAYLRTAIAADADMEALLLLGTDDAVKVWLNGAQIHGVNATRSLTPDEDRVAITLKQGENTLLLKVINGDADWGACARLRAPDGSPLAGATCGIKRGTP